MVNREECERAIEIIDDYVNGCALKENPTIYEAEQAILVIDKLITELFNNLPLKFEDLKEDMWVWDNKEKMYCQVISTLSFNKISVNYHYESLLQFKENRFYKREVKE